MMNPTTLVRLTAATAAVLLLPWGVTRAQATSGSAPAITDLGPHHRVWEWTALAEDGQGGQYQTRHAFTELAAGLNRKDDRTGDWVSSRAEFEQTRDGYVIARQTPWKVILAPQLNVEGAVDLLTPEGQRLRSSILGIALLDLATGENVMLAEVKEAHAELTATTEVLYRQAFDGLSADVRYKLTLDGLEQDVILREAIMPDLLSALGLDPATTRLRQ